MVVLLTLAYIVSFVDRYILGLLVEPIKADLELSDTQIGLILGPAFAIFYATMGLPLGWLADRVRRTWIVTVGITVWSLATAACGLAKNFWQLFTARMAVGVGEATLSPCALSMIADSFPKEKRGKPVAFYAAALSLGAAIASLAGAAVLNWTKSMDAIAVPVLGTLAPWQVAFVIVAIPGFPLALAILALREPARQNVSADGTQTTKTISETLAYVSARKSIYGGVFGMAAVMTIIAYSQGFLPAMFSRTWGWSAEKYALINGLTLLFIGPIAVSISGWSSDRLFQQGRKDGAIIMVIVGFVILLPTAVLGPLMPTGTSAFIILAINTMGIAMTSAAAPTAILNITPGEIRGQVTALYYMFISITGLLLGPTTIGLLSDFVFGEAQIRYAAALVPVIFGLPLLFFIRSTQRRYQAEVNSQEQQ